MEAKKSYSLDDQIAPSHVSASEMAAHVYSTQPSDPVASRDGGRLQVGRDTVRSAAREPVSSERSPSGSGHRKLLMLHTMRALQQDNYETTTSSEQAPPQSDTHAARTGVSGDRTAVATTTAVHIMPSKTAVTVADPPPRVPPRTSRVDRLPIARIWSRLKFDRRAVTASSRK